MYAVLRLAVLAALAAVSATAAASWNYRPQDGADTGRILRAGDRLLTTTTHGMAQSLDQGDTWQPLISLPQRDWVYDLVVDPQDAAHWYVQIHEPIWNAAAGFAMESEVRILETRDAGMTWQAPATPGALLEVPRFHPAAPQQLDAYYRDSASGNGYRAISGDGGRTWITAVPSAGQVAPQFGLGAAAGQYAGLGYGMGPIGNTVSFHLSQDGGYSWGPALATRDVGWQGALSLQPRRGATQQVYWIDASASGGQPQVGTVDLGSGVAQSFPPLSGRVLNVQDAAGADGATLAVVLSALPSCDFCNNVQLWKLTQGAAAWQYRGGIAIGAKFNNLDGAALLVDGATLWLSGTVGVYRSDDEGANWSLHTAGLFDAVVNAVSVDPRNGDVLLSGRDLLPLQRSSTGGLIWSDVGGQVPQDVRDLLRSPANPDLLFAAALGGLYRSSDAGATWQLQTTNVDTPAGERGWRYLAACANGELVARIGERYFRSSGGVASWSAIGLTGYYRLEWARRAPGRLYFVENSGADYYSDDCGATVQLWPGPARVSSVAVDPNDALHIVVRASGGSQPSGLHSSRDGGATLTYLADQIFSSDAPGWIDACDSERYTSFDLRTLRGAGSRLVLETPGMPSRGYARDSDSQCIGGESVTLLAGRAGLWLRRAPGDVIFSDGLQ